jgi:Bacterial PH domain
MVEDVEFRLGRGYRTRPLAQGCIALVLAVGLFAAGLHMPVLQWLAIFPLAYAAGSFAVSARRAHVSTRLTSQGIEIRRLRRRLVPWQAIRGIETIGYDQVADVPVANVRTRSESSSGPGPRTVAAVRIVRTSGHRIHLPAPLVTDSQADPDFDDKVQLIKERWQQAVAGTAGDLDHPASY